MKDTNHNIRISVIIPAFNEYHKIGTCLKSLSEQNYRTIEVILVDDCSNDNTVLIAREKGLLLGLNLKIIQLTKRQERGIARNRGAKESIGDYLLFVDTDMIISKNVITECVRLILQNDDIKAVIIPEESIGEGFWAQCRHLEKLCYTGDNRVEAARFFEKKAFWKAGAWDNKMISGEDWDLTRRMRARYQVSRIKPLIYHNEYKLTLWEAIKKKFYYASVSGIYLEKNPLSILTLIFFVLRPAYLRNWRLIILDPIHGLGMFILKTAEITAGLLGFLYSKL
ncbi:MAG: glycosyltransferase family 2 protein [Candidatus Levybacteria bacterium]|nr:glycosyltransferase family 2 protein [Candidatus Levybacteria bacterium]